MTVRNLKLEYADQTFIVQNEYRPIQDAHRIHLHGYFESVLDRVAAARYEDDFLEAFRSELELSKYTSVIGVVTGG